MYIGKQKIVKQRNLSDNFVEVTLEATTERVAGSEKPEYIVAPGLGKTEKVVFNKDILKQVATEEEGDLTQLRNTKCMPAVAEILQALYNNAINFSDVEHVFQCVLDSVDRARKISDRVAFKKHEDNQNLYDFKEGFFN